MALLSILIGLGFMLTGALGYFLAQEFSIVVLLSALIGLLMMISGLICMANYRFRQPMLQISLALSAFLLFSALITLPFFMMEACSNFVMLISLSDIVVLSALFWYFGFNAYFESRQKKKNDSIVAANKVKRDELGGK